MVKILNAGEQTIRLKKGTPMGVCELVSSILVNNSEEKEVNNYKS